MSTLPPRPHIFTVLLSLLVALAGCKPAPPPTPGVLPKLTANFIPIRSNSPISTARPPISTNMQSFDVMILQLEESAVSPDPSGLFAHLIPPQTRASNALREMPIVKLAASFSNTTLTLSSSNTFALCGDAASARLLSTALTNLQGVEASSTLRLHLRSGDLGRAAISSAQTIVLSSAGGLRTAPAEFGQIVTLRFFPGQPDQIEALATFADFQGYSNGAPQFDAAVAAVTTELATNQALLLFTERRTNLTRLSRPVPLLSSLPKIGGLFTRTRVHTNIFRNAVLIQRTPEHRPPPSLNPEICNLLPPRGSKAVNMFHPGRILALFCATACAVSTFAAKRDPGGLSDEGLFNLTNVWNVHLKVSPEAWEQMEPKGGGGFFGGRGPGGPRGGGEPPRFGPSMFIAPAFQRDGDANSDGKLSQQEFAALGAKWFAGWDKSGAGKVDQDQLRDRLNAMMMPPPGPGGPGGPPRMNLQGAEGKRNGVASAMMGIEFEYVKADLEFEGRILTNIALRYKGNGTFMASRGGEKRSLKLDLNDYVKGQKIAGRNKLNLHNNITDASWMNEVLSHRLFRDGGVPAPRTAYARVHITVPGKFEKKYFGLYSLVENVDDDFADTNFGSKKGGIFKPVTPDLFADLGEDWAKYNQTYDPKDTVTPEQKKRIIELCKLVSHGSDAGFAAKIGAFIDIEEFARYMAVLVYLADLDGILGPGQNFYIHLDSRTQKLSFIPWDLDHSFGQFPLRGTQEQRENLSIHRPWQGENKFLERMFKHEPFKKLYLQRVAEFSQTIFEPGRIAKQVDQLAAIIRPAVAAEDSERLERFDRAVAGKIVEASPFGGRGGPGMPSFGGMKPIKPFTEIRAKSIADQLAGQPGQELEAFGFGPPGGGGRRGPGGGGFGPGMFLAGAFMTAFDANKDAALTKDESTAGFAKLFENWNTSGSGALTDDELRAGIDKDLAPRFPAGGPGGPPR